MAKGREGRRRVLAINLKYILLRIKGQREGMGGGRGVLAMHVLPQKNIHCCCFCCCRLTVGTAINLFPAKFKDSTPVKELLFSPHEEHPKDVTSNSIKLLFEKSMLVIVDGKSRNCGTAADVSSLPFEQSSFFPPSFNVHP